MQRRMHIRRPCTNAKTIFTPSQKRYEIKMWKSARSHWHSSRFSFVYVRRSEIRETGNARKPQIPNGHFPTFLRPQEYSSPTDARSRKKIDEEKSSTKKKTQSAKNRSTLESRHQREKRLEWRRWTYLASLSITNRANLRVVLQQEIRSEFRNLLSAVGVIHPEKVSVCVDPKRTQKTAELSRRSAENI